MKKYIAVCSVLALLVGANVNAQAFQKGNKNIDLGIGFGGYGTTSTFSTTFNGVTVSSSESDGAASTIIPIGFEYGVGEKIGVGADLFFNNYFINDSDKVVLEKVSSFDVGGKFNYHLLNAEKNDLYLSLGLGFSNMKWSYQAATANFIESASGSGTYFSLGIADRIYFSDHIGISFNLGYRGYNYSNIEANLSSQAETALAAFGVTDYSQSWTFKMTGVHFGMGLAIKL